MVMKHRTVVVLLVVIACMLLGLWVDWGMQRGKIVRLLPNADLRKPESVVSATRSTSTSSTNATNTNAATTTSTPPPPTPVRPATTAYVRAPGWGIEKTLWQEGSVQIRVLCDGAFDDSAPADYRVAVIAEPPVIDSAQYLRFRDPVFYGRFNAVYTHSEELLQIDKRFRPYWFGGTTVLDPHDIRIWTDNDIDARFSSIKKTHNVSLILSHKRFAPGHILRHEVLSRLQGFDAFGSGTGSRIESKRDALMPYRFSIVIENGKDQGLYFSEKLVDAIVCGTIPIYWSASQWTKKLFDGLLYFDTLEELETILQTPDWATLYAQNIEYVRSNMRKALQDLSVIDPEAFRPVARRFADTLYSI